MVGVASRHRGTASRRTNRCTNDIDVISMSAMAYEVTTGAFEGPFDLLLHLILREQVDLYEISLTSIVDAYLRELEAMERCNLEVATEFLLIAATLVELKTRRLLPGRDDGDLDEELALWEERDLLLARLLECKTFKDVARVLARFADDAARSYPRAPPPSRRPRRNPSPPPPCGPGAHRRPRRVDRPRPSPRRCSRLRWRRRGAAATTG